MQRIKRKKVRIALRKQMSTVLAGLKAKPLGTHNDIQKRDMEAMYFIEPLKRKSTNLEKYHQIVTHIMSKAHFAVFPV